MSNIKLALTIYFTSLFVCLYIFISPVEVVQASNEVMPPTSSYNFLYTFTQTSTITTTIYPIDTAIIFEELAIAAKGAQIFTITDVQGTPVTIYESSKLEKYKSILEGINVACGNNECGESIVEGISATCGNDCAESRCDDPIDCLFPECFLPCCDILGNPCMIAPPLGIEIAPTSVLELEIYNRQFTLSEDAIKENVEGVRAIIEYIEETKADRLSRESTP